MKNNRAFTLIELSIVLVIISLIVGGVIGGKSLIDSAKISKQITQFGELTTAINNFDLQYDALPGDFREANAYWSTTSSGNGDGNIDQSGQSVPSGNFDQELRQFFVHLFRADLWKSAGASGALEMSKGFPAMAGSPNNDFLVGGRWHGGNTGNTPEKLTSVYGMPEALWMHMTMCNHGQTTTSTYNDGCGVMSAVKASRLDTKLDDGRPLRGKFWSYANSAIPASEDCLNGSVYDKSVTNDNACQMSYIIK